MRKFWTASVTALAFTLIAAPAAAQAPWSGSGELTDSDRTDDASRRYDEHPIRLEAGQRYRIAVDATAFDPVARLYRVGTAEPVAENDDGEGFNSRINYSPTESGDYVLRVVAFAEDGRGAYTASVALRPPLAAAQGVPFAGSGRIADGDSVEEGENGRRYDDHVVRLEAGRRYRFAVDASDFDPTARLIRGSNDEVVAENDDGDGLNSRIGYRPTESGDYILRVLPLNAEGRGNYRASVEIAPPWPAPATQFQRMEATIWRVYAGALTNADATSDNGIRFDDYQVHLPAGRERWIALDASFDTVVQVFRADDREGEPIASNDDSGGTLNSMLAFTPEQEGDYIVRVTALGNDARGTYRLRISE